MRDFLKRSLFCCLCVIMFPPAGAQELTTGALAPNLPVQQIGANDLLALSVYGSPELTRSVRVGADGEIRLPMLKQRIKAEGLLPEQLEKAIAKSLVDAGLLVDPAVTVTIAEYHSRPISVVGAVRMPQTFQAAGPMTLLQAIARAGGLDRGAGAEILVSRMEMEEGQRHQTTIRVPVRSLIEGVETRWNLRLEGGEEIRVAEAARIFVIGNVKKPGAFSPGEVTDASVMKAIAVAEGLLPFSAKLAYIYRPDATGAKKEIAVDLDRILARKSPDCALQANDVLYVPDNKHKRMTAIALERILTFGSNAGATALIYSR